MAQGHHLHEDIPACGGLDRACDHLPAYGIGGELGQQPVLRAAADDVQGRQATSQHLLKAFQHPPVLEGDALQGAAHDSAPGLGHRLSGHLAVGPDASRHVTRFEKLAVVGIEDGLEWLRLRCHLCQCIVGILLTLLRPGATALLHQPQAHHIPGEAEADTRRPCIADPSLIGEIVGQALPVDHRVRHLGTNDRPGSGADPGKVRRPSRHCGHGRSGVMAGRGDQLRSLLAFQAHLICHMGQELAQIAARRHNRGKDVSWNPHALQHLPRPSGLLWVVALGRRGVAEFANGLAREPIVEQIGDGQEGLRDVEHWRSAGNHG